MIAFKTMKMIPDIVKSTKCSVHPIITFTRLSFLWKSAVIVLLRVKSAIFLIPMYSLIATLKSDPLERSQFTAMSQLPNPINGWTFMSPFLIFIVPKTQQNKPQLCQE